MIRYRIPKRAQRLSTKVLSPWGKRAITTPLLGATLVFAVSFLAFRFSTQFWRGKTWPSPVKIPPKGPRCSSVIWVVAKVRGLTLQPAPPTPCAAAAVANLSCPCCPLPNQAKLPWVLPSTNRRPNLVSEPNPPVVWSASRFPLTLVFFSRLFFFFAFPYNPFLSSYLPPFPLFYDRLTDWLANTIRPSATAIVFLLPFFSPLPAPPQPLQS